MDYTRIYERASQEASLSQLARERKIFEAAIENYEDHMMGLSSVRNARDLGGYITSDGRVLKTGRLLRTGQLSSLSDDEEKLLHERYRPSYILDMRSGKEQKEVPDKTIRGAEHVEIKLLEEVTSERVDELDLLIRKCEDSEKRAELLAEYSSLIDMKSMYLRMVREKMAIEGLRKFFSYLLRDDADCVIWHCRSGKDRSGFASALLLYFLGCSMETVKLDYYTSNAALYSSAEKYVGCMYDNGYGFETANRLAAIVGVNSENIDIAFDEVRKVHGGMDNYMYLLGLGEAEVKKLREKYLI